MTRSLTALALAASVSLPAVAGQAASVNGTEQTRGVAAAFGNTVKAEYPDGRYQRLWLRADGTWEAVGRRGSWSSGKWSEKGDKVCLKQARPFPAPFKYCTEFPTAGGLGAAWSSHDISGEPIRLTVVRGIERPAGGAGS